MTCTRPRRARRSEPSQTSTPREAAYFRKPEIGRIRVRRDLCGRTTETDGSGAARVSGVNSQTKLRTFEKWNEWNGSLRLEAASRCTPISIARASCARSRRRPDARTCPRRLHAAFSTAVRGAAIRDHLRQHSSENAGASPRRPSSNCKFWLGTANKLRLPRS